MKTQMKVNRKTKINICIFLKLRNDSNIDNIVDERVKITLVILPADYPNSVVSDVIKLEINNLINSSYKTRLKGNSKITVNNDNINVHSGLMKITCGDISTADWISFNVQKHNWVRIIGKVMVVP